MNAVLWAACVALPAAASRIAAPVEPISVPTGQVGAVAVAGAARGPGVSLPAPVVTVASPVVPQVVTAKRRFVPSLFAPDAPLLARVFDGRPLAEASSAEPVDGGEGKAATGSRAQPRAQARETEALLRPPAAGPPAAPPTSRLQRAWILATAPFSIFRRPTNDRDWSEDVAILPEVRVTGERVSIKHVRNFDYRSPLDWTPRYYDADYDLANLETVWFVVEPFSGESLAHTFVSFGFKGGRYVSISAEVRRTKGEDFSPWRGLFNGFELTYVIGDERDLTRLRSNYRKHDVFVYPVRASKEKARELFLDMVRRAESLRLAPEFYNSITNTCLTNIQRHINRIAPKTVPWSYKVLLPGYSDRLAYDLGLLDTDLPFEKARTLFRINERAAQADRDPAFSARIRRRLDH